LTFDIGKLLVDLEGVIHRLGLVKKAFDPVAGRFQVL